jgi:diguanylate cyclase (GGDEF)-like protein/PAS domain S-box-containing protein
MKKLPTINKQTLRKKALDQLSQSDAIKTAENAYHSADRNKLMHELIVHQVELEMQNQELLAAKKQADFALNRYSELFEFAPVIHCTVDRGCKIKTINLNGASELGLPRSSIVGRELTTFIFPDHQNIFKQRIESVFNKSQGTPCELQLCLNTGPIWVQANFNLIQRDNECFVALTDITEKKLTADLLLKQARFDALTGLPNRHLFEERLADSFNSAQRNNKKFSLLSLDLDQFKDVNDSFGHHTGDQLLVEASQRLQNCVRGYDSVFRLGGDEFIVIVSEVMQIEDINQLAQRILNSLSTPFHLDENEAYVSVSIGIAVYPEDGKDADSLMKNADQAMYAAKNDGRNCVRYFTQSMEEKVQKRLTLSNNLRQALSNSEFWLAYQPIVNLKSGQVDKAESLLRWTQSTEGNISPTEFIPVAEDSGLIHSIGNWVFDQVTLQTQQWIKNLHPHFQISMNMSPAQFKGGKTHYKRWLEHLNDINLDPSNIVIEITEGLLMDNDSAVMSQLDSLDAAGVKISIDDFGTGYSSLAYLKKFHINYLKIDQSFVNSLTTDPDSKVLCEAIIFIAHKLGLEVIAEGIETTEQRDLLINLDCDYGQGYLFSKPLNVSDFEQFMLKNKEGLFRS